MLAKKILKNLENGNYRIECREHCDCRFDWRLDNGELVCDIVSNDGGCWIDNDDGGCWIENVLIMDDLAGQRDDTLWVSNDGIIANYDAHLGLTVSLIKAPQDALQEIVKAIKNSDAIQIADIDSPDANNDLHDQRKRESLVKWLSDNDYLQTYVYYPRDFANEYECILIVKPYYFDANDAKDMELLTPKYCYPKSADKWVEMFLQTNTLKKTKEI